MRLHYFFVKFYFHYARSLQRLSPATTQHYTAAAAHHKQLLSFYRVMSTTARENTQKNFVRGVHIVFFFGRSVTNQFFSVLNCVRF